MCEQASDKRQRNKSAHFCSRLQQQLSVRKAMPFTLALVQPLAPLRLAGHEGARETAQTLHMIAFLGNTFYRVLQNPCNTVLDLRAQ